MLKERTVNEWVVNYELKIVSFLGFKIILISNDVL